MPTHASLPNRLLLLCLQIVLENSSREDKHECPFGRSAIELTKMLCEILQVGELRKSAPPPPCKPLCSQRWRALGRGHLSSILHELTIHLTCSW